MTHDKDDKISKIGNKEVIYYDNPMDLCSELINYKKKKTATLCN